MGGTWIMLEVTEALIDGKISHEDHSVFTLIELGTSDEDRGCPINTGFFEACRLSEALVKRSLSTLRTHGFIHLSEHGGTIYAMSELTRKENITVDRICHKRHVANRR